MTAKAEQFPLRKRALIAALAALALAAALWLLQIGGPGGGRGLLGPESAAACGRLPVSVQVRSKFGKAYALSYKKKVAVNITNKGRSRIRGLMVQIYTFDGFQLGGSGAVGRLGPFRSKTVKVNLRVPMQPGKVTMVVKGNNFCGFQQANPVVAFHACKDRLPVSFKGKPGGKAADYEDFLSVPVEPKGGQVIHHPRTELFTFNGEFVGHDVNHYRLIFGQTTFDNKLNTPLQPGGYTMLLRGSLNQPKSCGPKTAQVTMNFG